MERDLNGITESEFNEIVKRSAGVYRYQRIIMTLAVLIVMVGSVLSGVAFSKTNQARNARTQREVAVKRLTVQPDLKPIIVGVPVTVYLPATTTTATVNPADLGPAPIPAPPAGPPAIVPASTVKPVKIAKPAQAARTRSTSGTTIRKRTVNSGTVATSAPATSAPGKSAGKGNGKDKPSKK